MSAGLGREDIRALLDDLSAELAARGARAELFLVGGAALAVAYDATRATRDLDAVFIPTDVVRQAAAAVAEREGLAEDWLNDAVKGFLPGPDPDAQRFYSSDSLIVDVASPRYLLAMKLFAARAEIDADDIILLYRQLGFTTVDEGLDLVEQAYPGRPIPAKVKFLLTEIVDVDAGLTRRHPSKPPSAPAGCALTRPKLGLPPGHCGRCRKPAPGSSWGKSRRTASSTAMTASSSSLTTPINLVRWRQEDESNRTVQANLVPEWEFSPKVTRATRHRVAHPV